MTRSVTGWAAAALVAAVFAAPTVAGASDRKAVAAGVIGGMSAGAILSGQGTYPYYGYGYRYYPGYVGYPAPAYYPTPAEFGPPPGCVIRQQRVWTGSRWTVRKLRICH